jgi:hypothetical protein
MGTREEVKMPQGEKVTKDQELFEDERYLAACEEYPEAIIRVSR